MTHVLILGATGFVGGAIARYRVRTGHCVSGLVRSDTKAAQLTQAGIDPVQGDTETELSSILKAAPEADVVIKAAQIALPAEQQAVASLLDALTGSAKTFLFLRASGVLCQRTDDAWNADSFAEDDALRPEPLAITRVQTEERVRAAAGQGVRPMVVRPRLILGPGDHGHVSMVYQSVSVTGAACYVGDGLPPTPMSMSMTSQTFSAACSDRVRRGRSTMPSPGKPPTAGSPTPSPAIWALRPAVSP